MKLAGIGPLRVSARGDLMLDIESRRARLTGRRRPLPGFAWTRPRGMWAGGLRPHLAERTGQVQRNIIGEPGAGACPATSGSTRNVALRDLPGRERGPLHGLWRSVVVDLADDTAHPRPGPDGPTILTSTGRRRLAHRTAQRPGRRWRRSGRPLQAAEAPAARHTRPGRGARRWAGCAEQLADLLGCPPSELGVHLRRDQGRHCTWSLLADPRRADRVVVGNSAVRASGGARPR